MKKSDVLPVPPAREKKPVKPTVPLPDKRKINAGPETTAHPERKIWPLDIRGKETDQPEINITGDADEEDGRQGPKGEPW